MIKILFICHGNICRSPMAEYVFKEMVRREGLTDKFYIESAATSREEIENNRRNLMRIIGSDTQEKVYGLLDFAERPRDIADPWYTGNFDVTYDDVVEGCQCFLTHLKASGELRRN